MWISIFSKLQGRFRIRFGFDAFIAYNRGSAANYARNLYGSLIGEPYQLVCFIDERGFKPGTRLRPRTILTLIFSHMLIVVFTSQARLSVHVRREVSLFLWLRKWFFWNRPVSILDVEGEWQRALSAPAGQPLEKPWATLADEARKELLLYEVETTFATSQPSAEIRERYGGWKQFERLRRRDIRVVLGSLTAAVVLALLAAGVGFAAYKANLARAKANELAAKADQRASRANELAGEADRRAREANELAGKADQRALQANQVAQEAEGARKSAFALKLGAQAQQAVSRPQGMAAETGVLLAAESLRREGNLDASRALVEGVSLLPEPVGATTLWSGTGQDAWLSPDGDYAVMAEKNDDDDGIRTFSVKKTTATTEPITITPEKPSKLVAFSNNGKYVLMASGETVKEKKAGKDHFRSFTWLQAFALADGHPNGPAVRINGDMVWGKGTAVAALGSDGKTFAAAIRQDSKEQVGIQFGVLGQNPAGNRFIPIDGYHCFPILSNNGRWLAAAGGSESNQNRVIVWDTKALLKSASAKTKPTATLIHSAEVVAGVFSPNGNLLATAQRAPKYQGGTTETTGSPMVKVWDVSKGSEVAETMPHPNTVQTVLFNPDGSNLATSDSEGVVRVWSVSGVLMRVDRRPGKLSENDPLAQVALKENGLVIMRNKNGRQNPENDLEDEEIYDIVLDSYSLKSAQVELFSSPVPEKVDSLVGAISPGGRWAAIGTSGGISICTPQGLRKNVPLTYTPKQARFSPDGNWLVLAGDNEKTSEDLRLIVTLVSAETGEKKWSTEVRTDDGGHAHVSNNGIVAVEVGCDVAYPEINTFIFDTNTGEERAWELGTPPPEYSPDNPDGWFGNHRGYYLPGLVSISPDGSRFLMANEIRDARTGEVINEIPAGIGEKAVSFDSTGCLVHVAVGDDSRHYVIWDPERSQVLQKLQRLPEGYGGLSGDGFSVIVDDKLIWVYRVIDGVPVFRIDFEGRVNDAGFSADGKHIIATGKSAGLRTFLWQPADLIRVASHYVTRNLDQVEIDNYLPNEVPVKLTLSEALNAVP